MKRFDIYIFREVLTPTLIALLPLTFALVARELGGVMELIVRRSATSGEIWSLISSIIPVYLIATIPAALLVGILTGFGRMSSDSESVAFRAAGLSTISIFRPVLLLAGIACAANLILSVWVAPTAVNRLEELKYSIGVKQLSFALQPRVFNEEIGDLVLYVQDVAPDASEWRGILLADLTNAEEPNLTLAQYGYVSENPNQGTYQVSLYNGSTHIVSPLSPDRYDFSQWNVATFPIALSKSAPISIEPSTPQKPTSSLWSSIKSGNSSVEEQVEFYKRIALPFACLAFALIGLPLGLSTRRGGRSMGLVLSATLMLVYYMFFIGGTRIASNDQMSPFLGTWIANIVFTILGIFLVFNLEKEGTNRFLSFLIDLGTMLQKTFRSLTGKTRLTDRWSYSLTHRPTWFRTLDGYLLRSFSFFLTLVLSLFVILFVIVTLFELLPDIARNDISSSLVLSYFLYLLPQIVYWMMPLAVLLAVLVSLGVLTKRNETLAAKAGAISLYRLSMPLLIMSLLLSAGIYFVQDYVLPYSNQRQDEFRLRIKGRAPQTYRDPLRKWMAGSNNQIYHYNYFDPQQNAFAGVSIFEFDQEDFALLRWTFAARGSWSGTSWVLEDGWLRSTEADGAISYDKFTTLDFPYLKEKPEYFKKEVRTASQMTYPELRLYIEDLSQSGFDVNRLTVDLHRKFSFPLVSLIMAIIAIPFSFTTGRKGSFYGIGLSIVIGISYWAAFEFFETLGGINQLSPVVAAWFPNLIFGLTGLWLLLKVKT